MRTIRTLGPAPMIRNVHSGPHRVGVTGGRTWGRGYKQPDRRRPPGRSGRGRAGRNYAAQVANVKEMTGRNRAAQLEIVKQMSRQ